MDRNLIELKSISDLQGMVFFIPSYQRGYRWTQQQIKDLLNDVNEFNDDNNGFYCIQPLVVKKREEDIFNKIKNEATNLDEVEKLLKGSWEVIDGQQRLTTIYIILSCMEKICFYDLEYETRENSHTFLNDIKESGAADNIDYFHIVQAKTVATKWFEEHQKDNGFHMDDFAEKLTKRVKFIWYESVDENPVTVFTRLNIGKIGLTNAELIKALLLNRSNFNAGDFLNTRLKQQEIALEWDNMEYALQSEELWLFLNEEGYEKPTRIDMIFDLICRKDLLGLKDGKTQEEIKKVEEAIGSDGYRTFRYFYEFFRSKTDRIEDCWIVVRQIFQTFMEWFNDVELYHYVGYLVECKTTTDDLYNQWTSVSKSKDSFVSWLKDEIKKKIRGCKNLEQTYEINGGPQKTACKPLLLLHNIQTIINQAKITQEQYKQHVFYKFPFHLYKNERWDVEHIDSNTTNPLESDKDRTEWLKFSLLHKDISEDTELKADIVSYIVSGGKDGNFEKISDKVLKKTANSNPLSDEEKNQVWNFVLLDRSTNRGYGNSIFPVKRRCIIGKDQGKKITIEIQDGDIQIMSEASKSSFVPTCTKYAFLKYYNSASSSINYWDKKDAASYKENIISTLHDFIF